LAHFYADENFRFPVTEVLRRMGHDDLTAQEAGRAGQGIADDIVLADATAADRILLTQDRRDFIRLHNAGTPHVGIVVCTYDPDAERVASRIDTAVAGAGAQGRWLLRVNRPPV
jgi:predicted nuclease of predicted toxin-antitoxin system